MDELAGNGYSFQWRKNILKAALGDFKVYAQGKINRPWASKTTAWFSQRKEGRKEKDRNTWKKREGEMAADTAKCDRDSSFHPPHPRQHKWSRLSTMEKGYSFRGNIRFVESLGSSVADILVKSDPWSKSC